MAREDFKKFITNTKDFPAEGIVFRDISPLIKEKFAEVIDAFADMYSQEEWKNIDVISGVESRGFIFAAALAYKLNKGFVMIRKSGKLPNPEASLGYRLEYGTATIEMHKGKGNMLVVDDVLATGGTLRAACKLAKTAGYTVKELAVLIDLNIVQNFSFDGTLPRSLIHY